MDGDVCRGIITESKGGTEFYECKMLIDVSGDCDVVAPRRYVYGKSDITCL